MNKFWKLLFEKKEEAKESKGGWKGTGLYTNMEYLAIVLRKFCGPVKEASDASAQFQLTWKNCSDEGAQILFLKQMVFALMKIIEREESIDCMTKATKSGVSE